MKKKGFTLVELLAVIAILAILIIIVLPNIMALFNQAKQNSFENELKNIFKTAEQEWMKDSMFDTQNIVYARCSEKCPKELHLSGRKNIDYYVEVDKAGNIIKLFATDDTYQYEYKGKGLKIEQIGNSKQIAKLENSDVIKVSCDKIEKNGKDVTYTQEKVPVTPVIYWALQDNDGDSINETLVFSDKNVNGNKSGRFGGNNSFFSENNVPWIKGNYYSDSNLSRNVTTVKVEGVVAPEYTSYWLSGVGYYSNSFNVDLSNLNVSNVKKMESMFENAGGNATNWSIDGISSWDTSNVNSMYYMFLDAGVNATTFDIDLSHWDTSNVINMDHMFSSTGASATTWSLGDISNWDTSNVINMGGMFLSAGGRSNTLNLNLSKWDISKVIDMSYMFKYAGANATTFDIDLSKWDTSNVRNMYWMFGSAGYNATTFNLDLSKWNTSQVTNMNLMFEYAGRNVTTFNLDLSGWNTSNVINMDHMFSSTGASATTWKITIPKTNKNGSNNTTSRMYGKDSSIYIDSASGKLFTLAS